MGMTFLEAHSFDAGGLLDEIKAEFLLRSDREAAHFLEINQSNMGAYRHNRRPMPVEMRIRLFALLGREWALKAAIECFGPMYAMEIGQSRDRLIKLRAARCRAST